MTSPPRRHRVPAVSVLLGALCALLLGTAAPASAHAALTHSSPAGGSVVGHAPQRVTLTFSEGVSMSAGSIRVLGPHGRRADDGPVRDVSADGAAREAVRLRAGLPDGTYTVAWQAVSADSHPVSGAFTFSVGAPSTTSVELPGQQAGGGTVGVLYGTGRYAAYAGYLLLVGGAVFVLVCWPGAARVRAVRRVVVGGWVTLAAATCVMLLLRPAYATSGGLSASADPAGLAHAIGTKAGTALVDRLLLLAGAAVLLAVLFGRRARPDGGAAGAEGGRRRTVRLGLALGGLVTAGALAATWALSEHASTGIQPGVAIPVDIVHLLAAATWLGGLAALLAALHAAGDGATPPDRAVRRFSRLAFGSVTAVAATGTYQAWRQLGSWSALTDTTYGQVLLAKIALVAVLVALGARSRRWTARLADPPTAQARPAADRPGSRPATGRAPTQSSEDAAAVPLAAPPENAASGSATRTAPQGCVPPQDTAAVSRTQAQSAQGLLRDDGSPSDTGSRSRDGLPPAVGGAPTDVPQAGAAKRSAASGSAGERWPRPSTPSAPGAGSGEPGPHDPARAAQLARQRVAVATATRLRARDADPRRSALRRSVLAEAGVAVLVLAATTVLASTESGRTAQAVAHPARTEPVRAVVPFDTGGPHGRGTARITLTPGRSGRNTLDVRTTAPGGKPLDAPEVRVAFTLPANTIGPIRFAPGHVGTGHWNAARILLPVPGDWKMAVTVRTSEIDEITETTTVKIG